MLDLAALLYIKRGIQLPIRDAFNKCYPSHATCPTATVIAVVIVVTIVAVTTIVVVDEAVLATHEQLCYLLA